MDCNAGLQYMRLTILSNMDCNVGLQYMRLNILSNIIWTVM